MRYIVLILSCFLLGGCSSEKVVTTLKEDTAYFEFYSNYWINLHHFLYQKAKGDQLERLKKNGETFLEIGEKDIYNNLNKESKSKLENAIEYYKNNLIDKNLFRLGELRVWLQDQDVNTFIRDTTFSAAYSQTMNEVSEVYKTKFWPIHNEQNRKMLFAQLHLIKKFEKEAVTKLEELSGDRWPDTKVRVDLTAYANWAGAYTPSRPRMNIFISSLDPGFETSTFVEVVFHEGSHVLFNMDDPFRTKLFKRSEALNIAFPKNLWHASLFYLSGRKIQDLFKTVEVDHQMIMDADGIFSRYNTPGFRRILENYYQSNLDMNTTVDSLLLNHNTPSDK